MDSQRYEDPDVETEDLCGFCLDRIKNPEKLHCNHVFCQACLAMYLEARNWVAERCPICRCSLNDHQVTQHCNDVSAIRGPGKYIMSWRLFGFMTLLMMPLSLGPFYLLLIYW